MNLSKILLVLLKKSVDNFFSYHLQLLFVSIWKMILTTLVNQEQNKQNIYGKRKITNGLQIFWARSNKLATLSNEDGNANEDGSEKSHSQLTLYFFVQFIDILQGQIQKFWKGGAPYRLAFRRGGGTIQILVSSKGLF